MPSYLSNGWEESRWWKVVRFRLGNEMREVRYWSEGKDRLCMLCGNGLETWKHIWEKCSWRVGGGGGGGEYWQEACRRVLGDEEKGERWIRR